MIKNNSTDNVNNCFDQSPYEHWCYCSLKQTFGKGAVYMRN